MVTTHVTNLNIQTATATFARSGSIVDASWSEAPSVVAHFDYNGKLG